MEFGTARETEVTPRAQQARQVSLAEIRTDAAAIIGDVAHVRTTTRTDEATLIARLRAMREEGVLSRFGPLFKAEGLGGAVTLAAMAVPEERFEEVAALVNAHPEVAHNYARDHQWLNMWFVLATEDEARVGATIRAIEAETGLPVLNMPREAEYHVGLRLEA